MLGYTYANDNPVSGSDPTGLMNSADGDGGGGYTDDDVDKLYPVAGAVNDNPNPHRGDDGGGTNNDDGGGHHKKQGGGIGGWIKKRVNDVEDKVDEAHEWAKDHASEIGQGVAVAVTVVGVAAFCGATAGIGCFVVAGAVMGAAGTSLGYSTRIALDDQESFSTANYAREVVSGGLWGAAGEAAAPAAATAGAAAKTLVAKTGSAAAKAIGKAVGKGWVRSQDRRRHVVRYRIPPSTGLTTTTGSTDLTASRS
ncbi:hypothetical protein EV648_11035 [Kribbella sp. VKM Ac-2568]|nr:hypothetical protein EV648_11035 [Kribbella sp. VKM Ac-2568]